MPDGCSAASGQLCDDAQASALHHQRCPREAEAALPVNSRLTRHYAAARAFLEEGLALGRVLGDKRLIAYSLEAFAEFDLAETRAGWAARLLGAAEALRRAIGAPLTPADRSEYDARVAAARAQLGDGAFAAVWAEGRAMSLEQAVACALEAPLTP